MHVKLHSLAAGLRQSESFVRLSFEAMGNGPAAMCNASGTSRECVDQGKAEIHETKEWYGNDERLLS